ncbi:MAG: thiamine pyrophosphate-dependent enzyme [Acidobacteriota bacterium]
MARSLNLAQRRAAAGSRIVATVPDAEPARPLAPQPRRDVSTVDAFVTQLHAWGVEEAFGVSGGAIALLFDAIVSSPIQLRHFRHESGAAFAACEASFASDRPTVVFTTTGPGLLNSLTGLTAAKWDGAKVLLVSGHTNSPQRGRWATQETSPYTLPQDVLYGKSSIFDFAVRMETAAELPEILRRLDSGLRRPGGFVAHVSMPMSVQSSRVERRAPRRPSVATAPTASESDVAEIAAMLRREPFVVWCGFGARHASTQVRELVERSGAKIMCSPRAKGIFPERHEQYLGTSGLGGHEQVNEHMTQRKPRHTLVLGTRLGEATSFWDRDLLPSDSLIHVDLDPDVPGSAFPDVETYGVHAEIGRFLDQLLEYFPAGRPVRREGKVLDFQGGLAHRQACDRSPVRPQLVMETLQKKVVDGSNAIVLAECGNSFAWCNHYLSFDAPERYRVSTLFGSMGHCAAGVVGAALATGEKAVAVVGDGSMLMNAEVSTAAQYGAQAVWVVLNDAGYGMCRDGHRALGLTGEEIDFPRVDFVEWARSMGADGAAVASEDLLDAAFDDALRADGPFVLDIRIDATEASPLLQRFESLIRQGNSKNVAGWER